MVDVHMFSLHLCNGLVVVVLCIRVIKNQTKVSSAVGTST